MEISLRHNRAGRTCDFERKGFRCLGQCDRSQRPFFAAGHEAGKIEIWDLQKHEVITTLFGSTGIVYGVAFSPEAQWLASAMAGPPVHPIHLWDMRNFTLTRTLLVAL